MKPKAAAFEREKIITWAKAATTELAEQAPMLSARNFR